MSALPLRKGSPIAVALEEAQKKMCGTLLDAMRAYFRKLQNKASTLVDYRDGTWSLDARHEAQENFEDWARMEKAARVEWEKALAEYDRNAREFEAWMTAAKAANKIAS